MNRRIFNYARHLKANGFSAYSEEDQNKFTAWCKQHLPDCDVEIAWTTLLKAMSKVRYAEGEGPLDDVFDCAKKYPEPVPGYRIGSPMSVLAALCRELQMLNVDKPFYLPCREAGKLLGIRYQQANDMLHALEFLKIIQRVCNGNYQEHRASEFRYLPLTGASTLQDESIESATDDGCIPDPLTFDSNSDWCQDCDPATDNVFSPEYEQIESNAYHDT
ncbi:MAG: hypothetical protein JNJ77_03650 [Planctomycetia bacterium]|nr:hypothetical protein [Planctomycetia bacterium]